MMNKFWVNKLNSYKEAERFEEDYYLSMTETQRLEILQLLRDRYSKIKCSLNNENRKRLRRVIKIVQ